jgi:hypothetical protein
MVDQTQRLSRPSPTIDTPGVVSPRGINRNHLTLYLSVSALVLSLGAVAFQAFTFFAVDWNQRIAQTRLAAAQTTKEEALAKAAQFDVALKEQQIKTSAAQEMEALAAVRNHDQDTAQKFQQTGSDALKRVMLETILTPDVLATISRAARSSSGGTPNPLGLPSSSFAPAPSQTGAWGRPTEQSPFPGAPSQTVSARRPFGDQ